MVWLSVFHEEPQRTAFRAERRVRCSKQRTRFVFRERYYSQGNVVKGEPLPGGWFR